MQKIEKHRQIFPTKRFKVRQKGGFSLMPCGEVLENDYMGCLNCLRASQKPKKGLNRNLALILNLVKNDQILSTKYPGTKSLSN